MIDFVLGGSHLDSVAEPTALWEEGVRLFVQLDQQDWAQLMVTGNILHIDLMQEARRTRLRCDSQHKKVLQPSCSVSDTRLFSQLKTQNATVSQLFPMAFLPHPHPSIKT